MSLVVTLKLRFSEETCTLYQLGCWIDKSSQRSVEGERELFPAGADTVKGCRIRAETMGYTIFAVQNENACRTAANAGDTYKKYGRGTGCSNGRGGSNLNDVYEIRCPSQAGTYICYIHTKS